MKRSNLDSEYLSNRKIIDYFSYVDRHMNTEEESSEDIKDQQHILPAATTKAVGEFITKRSSMNNIIMQKYDGEVTTSRMLNKVSSIASLIGGTNVATASSTSFVKGDVSSSSSKLSTLNLRSRTTFIGNIESKAVKLPFKSLNLDLFDEALLEKLRMESQNQDRSVVPSWRFKERMRTAGVGLILALNIGTDPPDVTKPNPCARLHCWMDPTSTSRAKAREKIGELLENQYVKWQGQQKMKMRYKRALDPTPEEVRSLLRKMRSATKSNERILLHYNGYGVPRPTSNGELWVFDPGHTQYIPLSVQELRTWMGKPSMVVLDCNGAGVLLPFFTRPESSAGLTSLAPFDSSGNLERLQAVSDIIVLCPTSESEILPMNPDLPADLFTSCLTTPIKMALRWFIRQNPLSCSKIDPESVDDIPGAVNDRKTPLGELNWVFTAITDSIAWNTLPTPLFQSLFRQDLMVASMFRNFLLADRILRELKCTPKSIPSLPSTCNHPLWQAWDLAVETCLTQLAQEGLLTSARRPRALPVNKQDEDDDEDEDEIPKQLYANELPNKSPPELKSLISKKKSPNLTKVSSPFFSEQLTAFEIWLQYAEIRVDAGGVVLEHPKKQYDGSSGIEKMAYYIHPGLSKDIECHEQLPVVLQVLLSPTHRARALVLLRRFMYLGHSAVNLALSVGICPYVLKLLQSSIDEYKHMLIGIWSKILQFDPSCKEDLLKDQGIPQIIKHLNWGIPDSQDRLQSSDADLTSQRHNSDFDNEDKPAHQRTMALVILSIICDQYPAGQMGCLKNNLLSKCVSLLQSIEFDSYSVDTNGIVIYPSEFRMWLCICLGLLCKNNAAIQAEACKADIHKLLIARLDDDESDVRAAAWFSLGQLIGGKRNRIAEQTDYVPSIMPSTPLSPDNIGMPLLHSTTPSKASFTPFGSPLTPAMGAVPWNLQNPSIPLMQLQPDTFPHMMSPQPSSNLREDFDDTLFKQILLSSHDASAIVRNEALVVLSLLVQKYIYEFVIVANNYKRNDDEKEHIIRMDTSPEKEKLLQSIWERVHEIHQSDPHPILSKSSSVILRHVNRRLLALQTKKMGLNMNVKNLTSFVRCTDLQVPEKIQFHNNSSGKHYSRTQSAMNLGVDRDLPLATIKEKSRTPSSTNEFSANIIHPDHDDAADSFLFDNLDDDEDCSTSPLLTSKFHQSKMSEFEKNSHPSRSHPPDPLSPNGALELNRIQRNECIDLFARSISKKYSNITPIPQAKRGIMGDISTFDSRATFLGDIDEKKDDEEAIAREMEIAANKASLHLYEHSVLRHEGAQITNQLCFHSYSPFIAASDGINRVGIWNTDTSAKLQSICIGNSPGTRVTSISWMNERNHSLLLSGCDDGSVRIWDSNLDSEKSECALLTAFSAVPDLVPGKKGSGIVTEWQQGSGRLLAGGNSKQIRCWDFDSEKCSSTIETQTGSCLTCICTAWDYVHSEHLPSSGGISPDIVIGGFDDGTVKVFDLRTHDSSKVAIEMNSQSEGRQRRPKLRKPWRKEHSHWIVNVGFSQDPSKYEVSLISIYIFSVSSPSKLPHFLMYNF